MGAFRSILVDIDPTAAIQPGARVTLVDVRDDLPSSDYNGFMRKLEADVVDGRRAALARLAHTRPDVQCKASAARETQPAKLLDTQETELVIPFGN